MTEQERTELQQQFCVKTIQDMTEEERISFTYNVLMDSYTNNYTKTMKQINGFLELS